MRDDLVVKVHAADHVDTGPLIAQLAERAGLARAKAELFGQLLHTMRGHRSEEDFLRHGERVGPYLTCLAGLAYEQANQDWCERAITVLKERQAARAEQ